MLSANELPPLMSLRMTARLAQILETEIAIARLSEKVHGMILMGQDREDLKTMTIVLARRAKALASMCGDPQHFGQGS
ncbi:MAG TPA: hypothetical protein VGF24_34410 [Vicinamibacterales bacterium]|jgi:hypothetical protein